MEEVKSDDAQSFLSSYSEKIVKSFTGITWPSASWEDGSRRSAFQPYKPATVLTNLQRGNIQAKTPQLDVTGFSWYEKAGRGNVTLKDIKNNLERTGRRAVNRYKLFGRNIEVNVEDMHGSIFWGMACSMLFATIWSWQAKVIESIHDINATDKDGLTALMWSSAYGQNSTVSLLLQEGADLHVKGNRLETALHYAAAGGHHDIVKQLISYGADINYLDEDGYPPLIYAINGNHSHAAYELLQSGALMFEPNCYSFAVFKDYSQVKSVIENHVIGLLTDKL